MRSTIIKNKAIITLKGRVQGGSKMTITNIFHICTKTNGEHFLVWLSLVFGGFSWFLTDSPLNSIFANVAHDFLLIANGDFIYDNAARR